jgi:hypothetical protein
MSEEDKGKVLEGKSRFDTSEYVDYERSHTNNTWARGIKDNDERQVAYQSYCDHIASGLAKDGWYYDNPSNGAHCTWQTMEKWIKDTDEFNPFIKSKAEALCYRFFEKHLLDAITGANTKVNIAGLQMAFRNKYHWDRQERREVNVPEVLASYERVMLLLSDKQQNHSKAIQGAIVERIELTPDNKA